MFLKLVANAELKNSKRFFFKKKNCCFESSLFFRRLQSLLQNVKLQRFQWKATTTSALNAKVKKEEMFGCVVFQSFCIEPGLLVCCDSCPRSFHFVCAKLTAAPSTFVCHVCKQNNSSVVAAAALVEEPVPQDMDAGVAIVPAVEEETVLPPEPGFFFFFVFFLFLVWFMFLSLQKLFGIAWTR